MRFVTIVLLTTGAAVLYGILHDQVTARVCVEYFTIGHPRIISSSSPTMLALAWGVVATWWMGVVLGIALACCARVGRPPKLTARDLVVPSLIVLAVMALAATASALLGRSLAVQGRFRLFGGLAENIPPERHVDFITALWAHNASYALGALGGIALCVSVLLRRVQARRTHPVGQSHA